MEHETKKATLGRHGPNSRVSRRVLAREREVLLARLLLLVCDQVFQDEEAYGEGHPAHDLYNRLKPLAKEMLRGDS